MTMDKTSLVKVFLHDRGEDVESAWCQPAGEARGAALFRLVNVPFLHAKPTYGDVIVAARDDRFDGQWAWDRAGVPFARLGERLHEDGERYALIVDYTMRTDADLGALVAALERQHAIVAEGCFGPRGEEPGRLYLAAPRALAPAEVMAAVVKLGRGFRFVLVHPTPRTQSSRAAAKAGKKRPVRVGKKGPGRGAKKPPSRGAKKPPSGAKKPPGRGPKKRPGRGSKKPTRGKQPTAATKRPAGAKKPAPKRPRR